MYKSLNIAESIKMRAKQQGIVIKDMLLALGLGSNSMSNLRQGRMIAADSLARIADYLDCSVDYLLGRADSPEVGQPPQTVLTSQEKALLDAFRAADQETQLEMVHAVYTIRDKTKKADFAASESSVG